MNLVMPVFKSRIHTVLTIRVVLFGPYLIVLTVNRSFCNHCILSQDLPADIFF
jgi:hypothetical protein